MLSQVINTSYKCNLTRQLSRTVWLNNHSGIQKGGPAMIRVYSFSVFLSFYLLYSWASMALSIEGNPEFATVLKVIQSLGLKLHATTT